MSEQICWQICRDCKWWGNLNNWGDGSGECEKSKQITAPMQSFVRESGDGWYHHGIKTIGDFGCIEFIHKEDSDAGNTA